MTLPNGVEAWSAIPSKYVQESIKNVNEYMNKEFPGMALTKNPSSPFPRGYEAETDVSPVLTGERDTSYQSFIGVLRWMDELGRIDMITKVSMLLSHLAMPREGHLSTVFHIFG